MVCLSNSNFHIPQTTFIFEWCVHYQQCIKQVSSFKEEPGQSILQADSDELPHFSQFANFTQISRTKFGCDILQLYASIMAQHCKVSLCIKCTSSKIGRCRGGWLPRLCSARGFNRSGIREWPKCSVLWGVIRSEQQATVQWSRWEGIYTFGCDCARKPGKLIVLLLHLRVCPKDIHFVALHLCTMCEL